jgi:hypothetical protein
MHTHTLSEKEKKNIFSQSLEITFALVLSLQSVECCDSERKRNIFVSYFLCVNKNVQLLRVKVISGNNYHNSRLLWCEERTVPNEKHSQHLQEEQII